MSFTNDERYFVMEKPRNTRAEVILIPPLTEDIGSLFNGDKRSQITNTNP